MPFELSSFLTCWKTAIKEVDQLHKPRFFMWESRKASADLKRAGLIHFVQFEEDEDLGFKGEADWRSRLQFRQFETAVAIYEADARELSNPVEREPEIRILAEAAEKLRPLIGTQYGRAIRETATRMVQLLEEERSRRLQRSREKRDAVFFAGLQGLSGALKELVKAPSRDFDLDSRFQTK